MYQINSASSWWWLGVGKKGFEANTIEILEVTEMFVILAMVVSYG